MIEFDHVSMAYQMSSELALKNVSFKVARGEFVFIIGSSGSGKSTIIKLLTCEEKPLKGEILVNGFSLNSMKKKQIPYLRRNIGMVFQDFRLIPSKTVFENVAYAMEIVGASKRAIKRQVPMVLSIVGLRNRADAHPNELSGGEQQRVAIARAMVNKPMMILADEPTGNLDPANSESILALLQEINRNGTTVLVCTHDKELVDRMKRRVILIDDGQKVRDEAEAGFYQEVVDHQPLLKETAANLSYRNVADAVTTSQLREHDLIDRSYDVIPDADAAPIKGIEQFAPPTTYQAVEPANNFNVSRVDLLGHSDNQGAAREFKPVYQSASHTKLDTTLKQNLRRQLVETPNLTSAHTLASYHNEPVTSHAQTTLQNNLHSNEQINSQNIASTPANNQVNHQANYQPNFQANMRSAHPEFADLQAANIETEVLDLERELSLEPQTERSELLHKLAQTAAADVPTETDASGGTDAKLANELTGDKENAEAKDPKNKANLSVERMQRWGKRRF